MKKYDSVKIIKSILYSSILGGTIFIGGPITQASETNIAWQPRTSQQIKSEIKGNEYIIKWGDTLSAISIATDISINRLAEINQIANIDLIYTGNKLVFGGEINLKTGEDNRVVAVQDSSGKTSVVINTDENKPLVNQKETKKAKETENNGGTYTPPKKTDNNGQRPLPEVPVVPNPKPEEPAPPVTPIDPVKPVDPEPPIDPVEPVETEVDKIQLVNLYNSTTDYKSTDYEQDSWLQFEKTRNETLLLITTDDKKISQLEVDNMTIRMQNSIDSLIPIEKPEIVDKSVLTDLYNSTTNFVSTDYQMNSWTYFSESRDEAYTILNNVETTQIEVNNSVINLTAAINQLVPIENVDKSNLLALVNEVKDYQEKNYTQDSWIVLYDSFIEAVNILADGQATRSEVNNAYNDLNSAISSLEKVVVADKTKLIELYDSTASLDPNDYTEETWNNFILTKSDAKSVIDNLNANQEETDSINQLLLEKIEKLEKKVEENDFSKLAEKTPMYSLSMTEKIEASINAFRVQNGEKSLPISQRSRELSDANAKQNVSDDYMSWSANHNENAIGTTFSIIGATNEDEAVQKAMTNWINSPGHYDAMLWDDNGDIGASVYVMKTTKNGTVIYTFEFITTMYPDWM